MQRRDSRQHGAAAANTVDGEDTGRFSYISKRQRAQREGKFQLLEEYTHTISRHTPSIQSIQQSVIFALQRQASLVETLVIRLIPQTTPFPVSGQVPVKQFAISTIPILILSTYFLPAETSDVGIQRLI